ncbi:hypothetical protein [Acetivibrio straminisolvens]|uniref:hypothetical protein n=1 Tax=Acetivibrio straminisolvens TaxID=253314 RepID=UPI00056F467B|nr:hypothetical protein [Acetivibrio straminisolvens]
MEELYNRLLFSEMIFKLFFGGLAIVALIVLWFGGDVIKVKQKGVVVREIKLKKWSKFILRRLVPLIFLPAFGISIINSTLDYVKKDYLYGEGKMTRYEKLRYAEHIYIDSKYYNLPRIYRKYFSSKNVGTTYKFVYAKRTKLILDIEALDDESDNKSIE